MKCWLAVWLLVRLAAALELSREPSGNISALVDSLVLSWTGSEDGEPRPTRARLGQPNATESCTADLDSRESGGVLRFPCHCFARPGLYQLEVFANETTSLYDEEVEAVWPSKMVAIEAPERHVTLNGSVTLAIRLLRAPCQTLKSALKLRLCVRYAQEAQDPYKEVHCEQLTVALTELESYSLPCHIFDRAGRYQFRLYASAEQDTFVAGESGALRTSWNEEYGLLMKSDSLMPCSSGRLVIGITRPDCLVPGDRVRLYALHRVAGKAQRHSPVRLIYQKEERLPLNRHGVSFGCGSSFDIANPGYCFKYVSVLRGNVVRERATQCVATEPRGHLPLDGGWSDWGAWSECSGSCGPGLRHRLRLCHSPHPLFGGRPCPGPSLHTQDCLLAPCPNETWVDGSGWWSEGGECDCGCTLRQPGLVVIPARHCPNGTWIVRPAAPGFRVSARMIRLELSESDFLLIRDGIEPGDELLLRHPSVRESPLQFEGHKSGLRLEFEAGEAKSGRENRSPKNWQGAMILFSFIRRESGGDVGSTVVSVNLVHLAIGLVVCILALLFISLTGMGLWWYTQRKVSSNCAMLTSQSIHSSAGSHIEPLKTSFCSSSDRSRQLLSPGQLKTSCSSLETTATLHGSSKRGRGEFQPLLRTSRNARLRAKHLSRIMELPDEGGLMGSSVTTESTRLSGFSAKSGTSDRTTASSASPETPKASEPAPTLVFRRSIGIQLNSPALPLRRYTSMESRMSCGSGQPAAAAVNTSAVSSGGGRAGSPLSFAGTENDFEYDYYEPNLPGSFLIATDFAGGFDLESEIDIDQIIGDSELMRTPTHRTESSNPASARSSDERISTDSSNDAFDKAVQSSLMGDLPRYHIAATSLAGSNGAGRPTYHRGQARGPLASTFLSSPAPAFSPSPRPNPPADLNHNNDVLL